MTLSAAVAPHLPYLRRFARALTGTQASGDRYVAAVLESLIADPALAPEAFDWQVRFEPLFASNNIADSAYGTGSTGQKGLKNGPSDTTPVFSVGFASNSIATSADRTGATGQNDAQIWGFDVVLGNPPYVRYQDVAVDTTKRLK